MSPVADVDDVCLCCRCRGCGDIDHDVGDVCVVDDTCHVDDVDGKGLCR